MKVETTTRFAFEDFSRGGAKRCAGLRSACNSAQTTTLPGDVYPLGLLPSSPPNNLTSSECSAFRSRRHLSERKRRSRGRARG